MSLKSFLGCSIGSVLLSQSVLGFAAAVPALPFVIGLAALPWIALLFPGDPYRGSW